MDNNSLAHTKWNCKYHIVFTPKYGKNWTLRFYKDNINQYISMAELNRFDKQFTQYPIVLYGGEDENGKANSFSCQQRQRYLAKVEVGCLIMGSNYLYSGVFFTPETINQI